MCRLHSARERKRDEMIIGRIDEGQSQEIHIMAIEIEAQQVV